MTENAELNTDRPSVRCGHVRRTVQVGRPALDPLPTLPVVEQRHTASWLAVAATHPDRLLTCPGSAPPHPRRFEMGLDTSHDCWHGAYSAFTRWRNQLAVVAGYQLMHPTPEEIADGAIPSMQYPMIEWSGIEEKNFSGEWDRTPPDPLIVLIAHSDCDGVVHPAQAWPLANRLEELLSKLPDEDAPGHIGNWREKTQKFIDGLREAARAGEDVDFH